MVSWVVVRLSACFLPPARSRSPVGHRRTSQSRVSLRNVQRWLRSSRTLAGHAISDVPRARWPKQPISGALCAIVHPLPGRFARNAQPNAFTDLTRAVCSCICGRRVLYTAEETDAREETMLLSAQDPDSAQPPQQQQPVCGGGSDRDGWANRRRTAQPRKPSCRRETSTVASVYAWPSH